MSSKNENSAVILARVSSKSQEDEGYSIDSQLKLLQGYCQQRNLQVVNVFKIAETASKEQSRKVFQELLKYLTSESVFHLAVEKTDRLTRNFRDAVLIDEWLERDSRRQVHAVKESLVLHKEAKSDVKFMWNIHVSVAKKYTDNLREEAMKGWAEKLAQGWLPSLPPPGYRSVIVNGRKIHQPDSSTKLLIRRAFELYLEPQHTVQTVTNEMKLMGLRTNKGRPYSKSYVHKMLANPFYIGINRFNGKDYPGAQEPILSKDLFDRVQVRLNRKTVGKYRTHNPVFKGVIRCMSCKKLVTWQLQKGRYYGACQKSAKECKNAKLLREDKLELLIQAKLKGLVSPRQDVIAWLANAMNDRQKDTLNQGKQLAESIQLQIDRIKTMDSNMYDDKLAGEITTDVYKAKHQAFTEQITALEERISKVDTTSELALNQRLVLLELSQRASEIYQRKSSDQKRIILSKLFNEVTLKGGVVSVTYTKFAQAIAKNVQKTHEILGGQI